MAETDFHRDLMFDLIDRLDYRFADKSNVYVSGNLLLFYERGNKRKHVSPDVFVVFGVAKKKRLNYLLWKERKSPSFITELTSSSTKNEDKKKKFELYRDVLKVKEYFRFDPFGDYLNPRLQGFRLQKGEYVPIAPVDGRLPSEELGLHLEAVGENLVLWDPVMKEYIPTSEERAEQEKTRADEEKQRADRAEQEVERLRKEIEKHQRRNGA